MWGGGGVWGSGPRTDKHLPQSPFTGQSIFLDDDILHCLLLFIRFPCNKPSTYCINQLMQIHLNLEKKKYFSRFGLPSHVKSYTRRHFKEKGFVLDL
jgi:hypothetical protein